jgi:sigma-B regulation protein RsbU (phosphoserine phosphatase)
VLDLASGRIAYCNAGHPAPIVVRNSSCIARLHRGGTVLGYADGTYGEGHFDLLSGDAIVLFTDGVTEAGAQTAEDEFGEERLMRVIDTRTVPSASALRDAISNAVTRHSSTFEDDATLIALRRV